jgi:putative copper export protein
MTDWLLVLSLFVHIITTLVWAGGLVLMSLLLWPGFRDRLRDGDALLAQVRKRFYPIATLCLFALVGTGLYQMGKSQYYEGLLEFTNDWSRAMLVKHIAVGGIFVVGGIMQWGIIPALDRAALLASKGKSMPGAPDLAVLHRRERRLTFLNAALGVVVFFCTAIVTAL